MHTQDKTKEELIIELEELQKAYDSLKVAKKANQSGCEEAEENLSATLHSIGDGVIATDKNGLVIRMNPVAETLCGWNLTEALGKPLSEVFSIKNAETHKPVADPVKKVLEKGEIVGLANHTVLVSRNGTEYQIADSAAPIRNKDGEITGVVLVFSNVTDKYAAQEKIKESEERYRSLLNNLDAGIVVHAPDTSIVMNNVRASELLGLSSDQMKGKAAIDLAWQFIHEDNTPLTLDEYPVNRIVIGKQSIKNQVLGIHQSDKNDVVWVTVSGFPVLDAQGEITEIVISFIDISERKIAEEEIKKTGRHYQALIENAPDGIALVNTEGGFKYISPSAKKMFGYNPSDEASLTPDQGTHPDDLPMVLTELGKVFADPAYVPTLEYRFIDKLGNWHWVETTFSNMLADPSVEAIVLNFRDITERRQLDEVHTFLSTSGYLDSDENFFESLSKYLAKILDSEYVCIDKLEGDGLTAQTVAIYNEGKFDPNVSYTLKQTPCGEAVGKTICCFPENVCQLFPYDEALQNLKAHSYIGTTLWSFEGKPIGLIAIIGQKPMKNVSFAETVLRLVAIRAAGELERLQAEEGLKLAKEKAEANEEKYRLSEMDMQEAQRLAHIGSWHWDIQTGIVTWSKELYNINGHDPDIPVPDFADMASFYTTDSWKTINEAVAKTFNTSEPYNLDLEMLKPDGTIFFTNTRGSADYNEAGEMINLHGTVQDITERKLYEEKLKESLSLLRIAGKKAKLGGWNVNLKKNRSYWSDEVAAIHEMPAGYTPSVQEGINFYAPEWRERITEVFTDCAQQGIPYDEEMEIITAGGKRVWIRAVGEAVKDDNGNIFKVQGAFQDISGSKKTEKEIRLLNETLEQRVAERTNELFVINKELEFHLSELEQFSYVSNHDLQEPLRTLSQFTHLFNEKYAGKLDEEGNRYLDFISKSAIRMSTLVRDLLEYSLLGKESVKTLVDCNKIVDAVLCDLDDLIKAGSTKITVEELPVFTGYETEMRQLFQNLIGNAIKYQKPGNCPEIHISAENLDKEWLFSIQDNGIGIDQKYFEKIFIIFQRLHNRNEYDGTGIGLANCRKVVGLHGGKIWVVSTPGAGSTFKFTIPKL
jgi:PAS domain S-box-containing protein